MDIEDGFIVHGPNQKVEFHCISENVYSWVLNKEDIKGGVALVNTLHENNSFFTDQQIQKAQLAKTVFSTLAYPIVDQLTAMMVWIYYIHNNPVILSNADLIKKYEKM